MKDKKWTDRELGSSFRAVSGLYDVARKGYAEEVIEKIVTLTSIPDNGTILDVGCGSGKGCIPFAERGYKITAIDISKELIEIGKKKGHENIEWHVSSFENITLPPHSFDLIISAQAWHWIDPVKGFEKAHLLLKRKGRIALFWKFLHFEKSERMRNVRELIIKYCPNFPKEYRADSVYEQLLKSNLFERTHRLDFYNTFAFTRDEYLDLVQTFSSVISLSEETRAKLLAEISAVFEGCEEPFEIPYRYLLLIGKAL